MKLPLILRPWARYSLSAYLILGLILNFTVGDSFWVNEIQVTGIALAITHFIVRFRYRRRSGQGK